MQHKPDQWDVIIVGGGIIGAGVLREAARRGLKALLIEQRDFAWGTSSRSSKMVHGGLRYLTQGDLKLTRQSLQERERLLKEAPGLIHRMGYYFLLRKKRFPGRLLMNAVLYLYDKLAGISDHRYIDKQTTLSHFPNLNSQQLKGACYYTDTAVDDARLVVRVLQESLAAGGQAINYVQATNLIMSSEHGAGHEKSVRGVRVKNLANNEDIDLRACVVINATGAWADKLRSNLVNEKRIRPLRGSHLVFPHEKLPIKSTLALFHPQDKRPVFIFPWEGATLIGTTDLDHHNDLDCEPGITHKEVDYLLQLITEYFPNYQLARKDVISSYAGVRPVIASGNSKSPSKERRSHAVWADKGLITVSGGKLTTFRITALDTLKAAEPWIQHLQTQPCKDGDEVFSPTVSNNIDSNICPLRAERLAGRYGSNLEHLLGNNKESEWQLIGHTQFSLAECRWAIRHESVLHLDDLLLRRTRLGLLLKHGAKELFPQLSDLFQQELGWDKHQWEKETQRYLNIWQQHYSLPAIQDAP